MDNFASKLLAQQGHMLERRSPVVHCSRWLDYQSESSNLTNKRRWLIWIVGVAIAVLLLGAFVSMRKDTVSVRVARVEQGKSAVSFPLTEKWSPFKVLRHMLGRNHGQTSAREGRRSSQKGSC